jgi:hypothetical protein
MKYILWRVYARRVCRPDPNFAFLDLIQPLQGWTHGQPTHGRPCWANPGLYDSNPFGVAEFATLKGCPSFSPGLRGTSYPGFIAIRANPERVESTSGGTP